eukprot:2117225-Rhodomonas_salina.1
MRVCGAACDAAARALALHTPHSHSHCKLQTAAPQPLSFPPFLHPPDRNPKRWRRQALKGRGGLLGAGGRGEPPDLR